MCELLGLCADRSMAFTCSLDRFAAHGSAAGRNHDGWGVAGFEGRDVRIIKEAAAAADSDWVRFIDRHGIDSPLVVAHIRHASRGVPCYANTHPFSRELGGRMHVFAHNGTLQQVQEGRLPASGPRPLGATDSEFAFCLLLARLAPVWRVDAPSVEARTAVVVAFARDMARLGPANFLYSDGELLFAHADVRMQDTGRVEAPGLYIHGIAAMPADAVSQASGVDLGEGHGTLTAFASVPLTPAGWQPLARGEVVVVRDGSVVIRDLSSVVDSDG